MAARARSRSSLRSRQDTRKEYVENDAQRRKDAKRGGGKRREGKEAKSAWDR